MPDSNFRGTLRGLGNKGFLWYILGRIGGAPTGPMRGVVQGWLVYNLTGSAMALGWVASARALVMFLSAPFGGVLSDRMEKRTVMLIARLILMVTSFGLALLVFIDVIRPWHIAVVAMLEGIGFSIVVPAQHSIVSELVDRETLLSAMSVTSVIEMLMQIVGSAIAGVIIEAVGAEGVYVCIGLLLCFALYTLLHLPKVSNNNNVNTTVFSDLVDGIRYLRASPVLIGLLGLGFMRNVSERPYRSMLPAFTRTELGMGAAGLGMLTSTMGLGALASSLVVVSLGDTRHKGKLLLTAGATAGVAMLLLMNVRFLAATFIFAAFIGGANGMVNVLTRTLVQSNSEPNYRGRMSSVGMMLFSFSGISALPAGAMADRYGVPGVISILAVCVIFVYLGTAILRPNLRRLR